MLLTCDIEMHAQTSCPKGMSFGYKSTTWIDNILATILERVQCCQLKGEYSYSVISSFNHLMCLIRGTEAKGRVHDELRECHTPNN